MVRRLVGALAVVVVGMVVASLPASANSSYNLFGDATPVHPGNNSNTAIQLRSANAGFGGIDLKTGDLKFGDISNLGTDYKFTAASCGQGSPRFQINIDHKNAFVYIGPPPNYTSCPQNVWVSTGNLATPVSLIDTSQLPGGTFYDTFAAADLKYGSEHVNGIQIVADAGFFFGTQTVLIDNVIINDTKQTFEGE